MCARYGHIPRPVSCELRGTPRLVQIFKGGYKEMSKKTRLLALLLALAMCFCLLAACGDPNSEGSDGPNNSGNPVNSGGPGEEGDPTYTYKDSMSSIPANWNPHTYQTSDESVPLDYTTDSLFTMLYNDSLHPVDGLAPYEGYVLVPAMAADYPVDVTTSVKAAHPEFNIPDSATSGYAWSVKLRDDLKWDDGTPITAQDFVDSLERVLRPELLNYRAADYYDGSYVVVNAMNYSLSGQPAFQSFIDMGTTYADFIANGGSDADVVLDMNGFWSVMSADKHTFGYITDDTMVRDPAVDEGEDEDYVSAKYLWDNYLGPDGYYGSRNPMYTNTYCGTVYYPYEAGYSFDNVGLYVSGDNELTFVYRNAVDGFYLMTYAMSVPLVKIDLYDSLLKETSGVWSSTYNSNLATAASYGPYKLSDYQLDKSMHFVKNENWYGWNSGIYTYVDPEDGQQYDMYQTTDIDVQYVKEAATRKTMFLAGQLMGYGLQAEDFDQYRSSEYCYATPGQAVFGLILNGYMSMLKERENAADFDKATTDLEMMSVETFKRALAVSIDRDDMCASVSPARSAGFGLIGTRYVYDPETGALYRDTDQAKQALCDFYSVDPADYGGDLDRAVAAITGYDPVAAAELYTQAFNEGIELGYITDADGDGICDQTIEITYSISEDSDFMTKTLDYLNESFDRATAGTPLAGKVKIVKSAPLGDPGWSDSIQNGTTDAVLAGWSGATMDPFGFADTWTNEDRVYWGAWFDAKAVDVTINIDGTDITMSLRDWAECLNGNMKTVNGKEYNFGFGQTSVDNRLTILATCEKTVLGAYVTLPMLADASMALLSQQVYYVVETYSPMMGRGGISYMKYNYNDAEWTEYVSSQGGTLQY